MSWFRNPFKKKRLPARDHIGRFLSNDKGEMLYTDSPKEEIEKAKAKSLRRDEDMLRATIALSLKDKKSSTCGCDVSIKKCACSPKSAPTKRASADKKTPPKKK
jgi:hypothetical protein